MAFVVSMLLAWTGIAGATPAFAADPPPEPDIKKFVIGEDTKYRVGDTVTFSLNMSCYSQRIPCYSGTITDVLNPNLEYQGQAVSDLLNEDGSPADFPVNFTRTGQTLTWTVGSTDLSEDAEPDWFMDGQSFNIKVTAKVKSLPADGSLTIPNTATLAVPGVPTVSDDATVLLAPPDPASYDWGLQKTRTGYQGTPALGHNVTYDVRLTRPVINGRPAPGGVDLDKVTFKDILPEGATFVSATTENPATTGVYDAATDTINFPGSGPISASNMYCGSPCITWFVAKITVKYDKPTFTNGQTVTNKAEAELDYSDGHANDVVRAEVSHKLSDPTPGVGSNKYTSSNTNPAPGQIARWTVQASNTGNVPLPSMTLTDAIPDYLEDVVVTTNDWYMPKESSTGVLEFSADGDTWTPHTAPLNGYQTVAVPTGSKFVRVTVTNVNPTQPVGFYLQGKVKADTPPTTRLNNCLTVSAPEAANASNCSSYTVGGKPEAKILPRKAHTGSGSYKPGEEFDWVLKWRTYAIDLPKTSTIIDYLPAGFELVTEEPPCLDSRSVYDATPTSCNDDATTPAYTQEVQSDGTTKITFADAVLPIRGTQGEHEYLLHLRVRVKDGTAIDTYTNYFEVVPPATFTGVCEATTIPYGTKCGAKDPVSVVSSSAVGLQKWDKGPEPNVRESTGKAYAKCPDWNGYTRYPCVAQTLPGGDLDYRLRISNQGNVPLTKEVVYDILPHVNDTPVSEKLAGQQRGTEWTPVLTGPITVNSDLTTATGHGFKVEYNLSYNPCRPELNAGDEDGAWGTGCDDTWYDTVADWSTVKSFRIAIYGDGSKWAPGTRVVADIPMKAPLTATYSTISPLDLSVAWNSAAQRAYMHSDQTKTGRLVSEPRVVGVIVPAPFVSIGDYVWFDKNYNGKQDAGEKPAEGIKVTLKDKDGKVVATTTTDKDGYYWFQNLTEKTQYSLEFEKPDGYDWTKRDADSNGADKVDSDVDPAGKISFTSPEWVSGVSHNLGGHDKADDPTLDAGLVTPATLVSVGDYVWWDENRNGLQDANEDPIKDVVVELYEKDGAKLAQTKTDANGYYSFTDLIAKTEYSIHFLAPSGSVATIANAGGVTTNSKTGDVNDSDPINGKVDFIAEESGSNSGDPDKADNPGIDAGFIAYDLTIAKKLETTGTIYPRSTLTYTLTPKNLGPVKALGGWKVTDVLPAGLELVDITGAGYVCDKTTDPTQPSCTNAADLAAGAEGGPITVTVKVKDNASGVQKNVAYVTKSGQDVEELIPLVIPTLDTNTDTSTTNNDAQAEVQLTVPLVSVGDYVWFDTNRDGQQNAGEPGVKDVTVNLYKKGETTVWKTTKTDADGHYSFTDLVSLNDYTIEFVKPDGTTFTTQNSGGITSNTPADKTDSDAPANGKVDFTAEFIGNNSGAYDLEDNPGIDAGLIKYNLVLDKTLTTTGAIRLGQDVTYTLVPKNEGPVDALGGWSVVDLLPAGLTLKTISGDGYVCTKNSDVKGTCTNAAVLAAGTSGKTITVVATVGEGISGSLKNVAYVDKAANDAPETNPLVVPDINTDTKTSPTDNDAEAVISLKPLVSIGDYVWYDNNRDGIQNDGAASKYAGMTVELYPATGDMTLATRLAVTTTDADGYYFFKDLEASTDYRVKFVKKADESFTAQAQGSDTKVDSNPVVATGVATVKTPATGANLSAATKADDPTIDAGIVKYNLVIAKKLVSTGPFYERGKATFEIVPANQGPADELAGWSVTDLLPAGLTVETVSGDGYVCTVTADKTTFTCVAEAGLAAGKSGGKITVVTNIGNNVVGNLHNVTYVSPSPTGLVPETNVLVPPTRGVTNTDETPTDNDAQADLVVDSLVSIGDYVWYDTDRDGFQDESEKPVQGVVVNLYAEDGKTLIKSTTTDAKGFYSFDDLTPSAKYVVEFVKPADTVFTKANAVAENDKADSDADVTTGRVNVTAPASGNNSLTQPDDPTIDAGLIKLVSVGDYVWYDTDKDGQQDKTELPVPGVTVNLIFDGKVIKTTTTDADGFYFFKDLETTAPYTIEFVKPVNTVFTVANTGDDKSDSDADPATGKVNIIAPADGKNRTGKGEVDEDDPTIDAGLIKLVSVGDYVWFDVNRDGLQTEGEPVIPDVVVNLYDEAGKLVATTKTDSAGYYAFKDLLAETKYTIEFVKPADSSFTTALSGDVALDSNADLVTGKYSFTSPKSGSNLTTPKLADDPTIDAGLVKYNLKLTKTRTSAELLYRGETVTFELIPSNDGPVNALAGWSVTDLLPSQLVLVSMSGAGYQCTANVCVSDVPLAAGASGNPITVVAKPGASFKGKVWNVAYVAPATGDITETIVLGELPTNLTDTALTATDNDSQDFVRISPLTATEAADDGDGDNLAYTGSDGTAAFLGTGLLLLAAGGALTLVRRRRSVN